jgi:hypothetical protein
MAQLSIQFVADQDYTYENRHTDVPYNPERSRFGSGWWIIPVVLSGSVSWFFILRMAFFS